MAMTMVLMRVTCSDLNPGCEADLQGGSPDDLVLQYLRHSSACMHRQQVDLDDVLGAIRLVRG